MKCFRLFLSICCLLLVSCGGGGGGDAGPCSATLGGSEKIAGGEACSPEGQANVALLVLIGASFEECSGAYISPTAILTAGHCFRSRPSQVLVGSQGNVRDGVRYSVHPLYDGKIGSPYDMAILIVDRPIVGAPLPVLVSSQPMVGDEVVALGYGFDSDGREALARIQRGEAALRATYSRYAGPLMGTTSIVSSGAGSPCSGDSGGPVLARSASGEFGIIGLTSAGPEGCSSEEGRPILISSTQSSAALNFITGQVPDLAVN
jgi:hypothetical protein